MSWRIMRVLLVVVIIVAWAGGVVQPAQSQSQVPQAAIPLQADIPLQANAAPGNAITYQGFLQQNGVVVDGLCDLRFSLFDAAANGAQAGATLERSNFTVTDGYFTVNDLDFGAVFSGQARWMAVAVRCPAASGNFTTLTPRQPLQPAPYALYAANNWALLGNPGTSAATNFIGTTNGVTLTLKVSNTVALRLVPDATSPSVIGGIAGNEVSNGVLGATIAGGGGPDSGVPLTNRVTDNYGAIGGGGGNQAGNNGGTTADHPYATVGGGRFNFANGSFATIAGGQANSANGDLSTIGGGVENVAGGAGATISGGQTNGASGDNATVGGGTDNSAPLANATVGGGAGNIANGQNATVAGGTSNEANGNDATIGGGNNNSAATTATIAGGMNNQASASTATVGGGLNNIAGNSYATVSGGSDNQALGQDSVVAGGELNQAQANKSTVSGGSQNSASAAEATVSGGSKNQASSDAATVGGGDSNVASGANATIAGGDRNVALGTASTVAGGRLNQAGGDFATVSGGFDASASHFGQWAYAAGGFADDLTGEAQTSIYVLRGTTTGTTPTTLSLSSNPNDRLTIGQGRTLVFDIQIAARSADGESAGYSARGVLENQLDVTTLLGGAIAATSLGEDDLNWGATITADDSTDSLTIQVSGATDDSIRWVATVRATEVQN